MPETLALPTHTPSPTSLPSTHAREAWRTRYGPWALVTGASSGIGRAMAGELAAAGLHLVLAGRDAERLETLATALARRWGIDTRLVVADLGTPGGIDQVEQAGAALDIGLLVAAAGFGTSGRFIGADAATEQTLLAVNCHAVMRQALHFGRRFHERGRGGLILFGSIVDGQGVPGSAHYAATKAYVRSLGEGLRLELAPHGVDVLVSAPGPVHSGFAARANMRMGTALTPDTVARATVRALGRTGVVIPGALSKVLTYSLALLPRWARSRILGQVMHGMTRHQGAAAP